MSDGWSPAKVASFESAYWDFLAHVRINSKEGGGDYRIIESVYEAQKRLVKTVFDGLAEDIHDFKILKSRQLGCTTITRTLDMFWLGVHPGMQGAMVFDTTAHLEEARQEFRDMISGLPRSLKFPVIQSDNRYGLKLSNGSRLRFMAAGVRSSRSSGVLGRSSGINLVAASEMCSWENEEGIVSLRNSLSKNYPDRLYIWESTARGFNSWHTMWEEAKKDDLNQRTCFIGWWGKDDQRIERSSPKFARYGSPPPTETEARRIALVKELYGFEVDREQLAWYRELTDPNREMDEDDPEDSYLLQDQPWCVVAGSRVGTNAGLLKIEDVSTGLMSSLGRIVAAGPTGTAQIWRAKTSLGYTIEGTGNHPLILKSDGQVNIQNAVNHQIVLHPPRFADRLYTYKWRTGIVDHSVEITEELARLVGLFMGDGSMSGQNNRTGYVFAITCDSQDTDVIYECHKLIKSVFGVDSQEKTYVDPRFNSKGWTQVCVTSKLVYETFKALGLLRNDTGKTLRRVHVPEFIFRSPENVIREFLRGLFEADGFNDKFAHRCVLFSKWADFIFDVQLLLLGFGITSRVASETKINSEGREYQGNSLNLRAAEAIEFKTQIGFISTRKKKRGPTFEPQRNKDVKLYDTIVSVECLDQTATVYNVTVDESHLFDVNGILTHNTEDEAFQQSGSTFFDAMRLSEISVKAVSAKSQAFKFIAGTSFVTSDINRAQTRRDIELKVWEEPESEATYVVACDPAFGASEHNDRSCVQVVRCFADQLDQVAEYTSPLILTHQLAWLCWSLVGWYGSKPNSQVLFFLEINGPGEAVWKEYKETRQLLTNGYLRTRAREKGLEDIFTNARNYIYSRSDAMGPGHVWQWKTQSQLRVAVLERLRDFVHAGWFNIRSLDAIEELRALARDGDSIQPERHVHDDRAMSLAFCVRGYEDKLRGALIANNRTKEADEISRRRSPQDLSQLFYRNTLDSFLKQKAFARQMQQLAAARAAWRYR